MKIELFRFNSDLDHTNGVILINGRYECDCLEDEYRRFKRMHETRIPDGEYNITFRTVGGFHNSYANRYGAWHRGMLWIREVPGFEYILIHTGNTDEHTSGCLLLGDTQTNNQVKEDGFIGSSVQAYKRVYPQIAKVLEDGGAVNIKYTDFDTIV